MIFTENINHNPGLFNDTAGERQDPAKKNVLCRGQGLRLGKREIYEKAKRWIEVEPWISSRKVKGHD